DGPGISARRSREEDRRLAQDRDVRDGRGSRATDGARRLAKIDLGGRVALVTGSTRGIGRAIAESLTGAGARVAVVGRDADRAREAASSISSESRGYGCDVGDVAAMTGLIESVEKDFGAIDILVNNAGLNRDNLLMRLKDDDWDAVLNA